MREGVRKKDLTRYRMVTGAKMSGLTGEWERDGMVERMSSATGRRSWIFGNRLLFRPRPGEGPIGSDRHDPQFLGWDTGPGVD